MAQTIDCNTAPAVPKSAITVHCQCPVWLGNSPDTAPRSGRQVAAQGHNFSTTTSRHCPCHVRRRAVTTRPEARCALTGRRRRSAELGFRPGGAASKTAHHEQDQRGSTRDPVAGMTRRRGSLEGLLGMPAAQLHMSPGQPAAVVPDGHTGGTDRLGK